MAYLISRILVLCLVFSSGAALAGLKIASWNIERLGHGSDKSYPALARIGGHFDFIAVQEAMSEQGVEQLRGALERETGERWNAMSSHLIGRGKYKEMYAFVWRDRAVEYLDGAAVFLDLRDLYAREPYSARFRSRLTGTAFVAATVHILFGESVEDRLPEIRALEDYWLWLEEVYPQTPILLMGDFNLPPTHEAWGALKQHARPLVTSGATTVSSTEGRFANLYDNIWVGSGATLPVSGAGVLNGPAVLGWSHAQFRNHASDHVPVYVATGSVRVAPAGATAAPRAVNTSAADGAHLAVRGNRKSQVYHLPGCSSYEKVSAQNLVRFQSEEEARSAGYRKAGNCG